MKDVSAGLTEEQAAGLIEAVKEIDLSQLETRADLRELELRMTSAAAKLKFVLPIVPLLAYYDLELDTENFVLRSWRAIRSLFERLVSSSKRTNS